MGKIKDILRHSATGLNQRETAEAAGSSLGTVNTVVSRIKEAGIKDPLFLAEHELAAIVYPTPRKTTGTERVVICSLLTCLSPRINKGRPAPYGAQPTQPAPHKAPRPRPHRGPGWVSRAAQTQS
jgi:hypothetical protein